MASAASRVFGTTELLENILIHADIKDLFVMQGVNKTFSDLIATSTQLRRKMFLLQKPLKEDLSLSPRVEEGVQILNPGEEGLPILNPLFPELLPFTDDYRWAFAHRVDKQARPYMTLNIDTWLTCEQATQAHTYRKEIKDITASWKRMFLTDKAVETVEVEVVMRYEEGETFAQVGGLRHGGQDTVGDLAARLSDAVFRAGNTADTVVNDVVVVPCTEV